MPKDLLLVGSLPLSSAEDVFRTCAATTRASTRSYVEGLFPWTPSERRFERKRRALRPRHPVDPRGPARRRRRPGL